MGKLSASVACVALFLAGCGSDSGTRTPLGPSQATPAPATPRNPFAETYTQITVGEVVSRRVATTDPACEAWHCQHFRLTAPTTGRLEVVMTYSTGNLDISVTDSEGRESWDPAPVGGLVRVSAMVTAGVTYQMTVWEYEFPGVEYELRTTLQ